ncbi:MAG TPA: efflux RND transporter periplasmic adaptor subunit [Geminicoccaceae bacterium]|nr:efflux RND transporter periplasmic adaptor subunit [Geminicoccaceae bacterium]
MRSRHILAGLVGLAAVGVGTALFEEKPSGATYLTAAVERGDLRTTVTAVGTLNAVETVEVGSQLSGQIAELLVDFNDEVSEGQPLARLDPRTFQSEVRQAEAALEVARAEVLKQRAALQTAAAELASARHSLEVAQARAESTQAKLTETERDLQRKRALVGTEVLAAAHIDQAIAAHQSVAADLRAAAAEVAIAREGVIAAEAGQLMSDANLLYAEAAEKQRAAELSQAQIDLARTVITAPTDGVVIGRDVDRGQTVAASLEAPTLFTIAQDLRQMEVHAKVDEADIGQIRMGQRASFAVDAYPGRSFSGTVKQIRKAPETVENVVTYTVVLSAENSDLALLPGMTALVNVVVDEAKDVLKVPNAALRFQPPAARGVTAVAAEAPGGPSAVIWTPVEDGAVPVRVILGRSDHSATELVEGPLRAGQQVIIGTASPPGDQSWFGFTWSP